MRPIYLDFADTGHCPGLIIRGTAANTGIDPAPASFGLIDVEPGARLLAHDAVEHINGVSEIGCPYDELQAIGAMWMVRGEKASEVSTDAAAWDVEHALSDLYRAEDELRAPPCRGGIRGLDCDDDLMEIAGAGVDRARKELAYDWADGVSRIPDNAADLVLRWMRIGYRKARRRYGNWIQAHSLFYAVKDAARDALRQAEPGVIRFDRYGDARFVPSFQ